MKRALAFLTAHHFIAALAVVYFVTAALPASVWYKAGNLKVADAIHGDPVILFYDGGPARIALVRYAVTVRAFDSIGIACEAAGGPFTYRPGTKRPEPLTLKWWAPGDPRCSALPPGQYFLETCWTIHGILWGLVPRKTVCAESNVFTIRGLPEKEQAP